MTESLAVILAGEGVIYASMIEEGRLDLSIAKEVPTGVAQSILGKGSTKPQRAASLAGRVVVKQTTWDRILSFFYQLFGIENEGVNLNLENVGTLIKRMKENKSSREALKKDALTKDADIGTGITLEEKQLQHFSMTIEEHTAIFLANEMAIEQFDEGNVPLKIKALLRVAGMHFPKPQYEEQDLFTMYLKRINIMDYDHKPKSFFKDLKQFMEEKDRRYKENDAFVESLKQSINGALASWDRIENAGLFDENSINYQVVQRLSKELNPIIHGTWLPSDCFEEIIIY